MSKNIFFTRIFLLNRNIEPLILFSKREKLEYNHLSMLFLSVANVQLSPLQPPVFLFSWT